MFRQILSEEHRSLRRIRKAALKLFYDERIVGFANDTNIPEGELLPEGHPYDGYEVPPDAWERFEKVLNKELELDDD